MEQWQTLFRKYGIPLYEYEAPASDSLEQLILRLPVTRNRRDKYFTCCSQFVRRSARLYTKETRLSLINLPLWLDITFRNGNSNAKLKGKQAYKGPYGPRDFKIVERMLQVAHSVRQMEKQCRLTTPIVVPWESALCFNQQRFYLQYTLVQSPLCGYTLISRTCPSPFPSMLCRRKHWYPLQCMQLTYICSELGLSEPGTGNVIVGSRGRVYGIGLEERVGAPLSTACHMNKKTKIKMRLMRVRMMTMVKKARMIENTGKRE